MTLKTLALAATLALAGSAFAATAPGYGHEPDASKHIQAYSQMSRHEAKPMKRVSLLHPKRHHVKHVALTKQHRREYAFTRHGKEHLAASSQPQHRHHHAA